MISIYQGSILDCEVAAIVNPANGHLRHGGGLARIIADAAAPALTKAVCSQEDYEIDSAWHQEQADHPLIATGNVGVTSAGRLPYKAIIHAVGPVWNGGSFFEEALLYAVHVQVLQHAYEAGYESIAIPAISCGIFGFPVERAAPLAMQAAVIWRRNIRVTFALFEDAHVEAYKKALRGE